MVSKQYQCGTIVEQMIICDERIREYTNHFSKDSDGEIMKFDRYSPDEKSVEDLILDENYIVYSIKWNNL